MPEDALFRQMGCNGSKGKRATVSVRRFTIAENSEIGGILARIGKIGLARPCLLRVRVCHAP